MTNMQKQKNQRSHEGNHPAPIALVATVLLFSGCAGAEMSRLATPGVRVASTGAMAPGSSVVRRKGDRHLIKTGYLTVITKKASEVARKAASVARQLGGLVARSHHSEKRSTVTLRVPNAQFQLALTKLKGLGELESVEVRGRDVTAQVIDLDIRLKTTIKVRERYLELLAKAQNVAEALPVQQQLDTVNMKIERMKGQLKVLRDQVAMSTIHMTAKHPVRPGIVGWVFYGLYKGVKWLFVWD
ncbi:MAG: DUF4349 domain-containing protein [Deltaproteobacteria bacterium]|nr:DUF4349 domain-containing protein [Deltaproteobacteria bacterium]